MTDTTFSALGLAEPLCRALAEQNYTAPTPIQAQAIPSLLKGRDILGLAQTGTGKTAAFALPLLQKLHNLREPRRPKFVRALILAPTRELAVQIDDNIKRFARHLHMRHAVIVGGVGQTPQVQAMAGGLDILVATTGRLIDHMNQGNVRIDAASTLVLDEADRMFDMGFIHDIRRIVAKLPKDRQSMLFSATMPPDVAALAESVLRDPVRIDILPPKRTAEKIDQSVYFVANSAKRALLAEMLQKEGFERVLVFTRTKHTANRVSDHLDAAGIASAAIHGNKSQNARQNALNQFRDGRLRVLVATDIAARGLDIDDVSHVVNYEIPNEPETYVHRIGRTARAGREGVAISFCDASENAFLRDIERLTRGKMAVAGGVQAPDAPPPAQGGQNRHAPSQKRARPRGPAGKPKKQGGGAHPHAPARQHGNGQAPKASRGKARSH